MRGNFDGKTNRRVEISIAGTASLTNLRKKLQNPETQGKQCMSFEHGVMMSPRVRYLIFSIYLFKTIDCSYAVWHSL